MERLKLFISFYLILTTSVLSGQEMSLGSFLIYSSGAHVVLNDMGLTQSGAGEFSGTGTVILTGTSSVVLENTGSNDLIFYDLEISNSGGVTLNDPVEVANNLNFITGIIDANTDALFFGPSATVLGAGNNSHVNGEVIKEGSADFVFPIGDNGIYQPIEIFDLTGASTFSAQYFDQPHPDPIGPYFNGDQWPVSTCDYWSLTQISGVDSARIRLTYGNNPCNEVNDFNLLRVARYSGGVWEVPTLLGDDPATGSVATIAAAATFGDFALASDNGFANVLPIELLHFDAKQKTSKVLTKWITASETNNDYFVVEKSKTISDFSEVGRVEGAGNSNTELQYELSDVNPFEGLSYYRLKQVDFDGSETFSQIVAVEFEKPQSSFSLINAYPCEQGICINYQSKYRHLQLRLYSSSGKLIYSTQLSPENSFFTMNHELAHGIYHISLSDGKSVESKKVFR
jgi:hypothetical protein